MTTRELVSMIEGLSADDYNRVVALVEKLSSQHIKPVKLNRSEIIRQLLTSAQRSDAGETRSARSVSKAMRDHYAV